MPDTDGVRLPQIVTDILLYRVEPNAILLVAVFHAKRDPKIWRARK